MKFVPTIVEKRKKDHFDYRTNMGVRVFKEDWKLWQKKCKALGLTYADAFRLMIEQFNETVFIVIDDE